MPTPETPAPITATVELPIGELHVVASEHTETTVEVHSAAEDRAHADAVRVELVGQALHVTGPALRILDKLTPKTPGRSIEVEVALPTGSELSVRSGYGGVRADGRVGPCSVYTRYGDVRIEDAASATIVAAYGQARVTGNVDGEANLVADHGGVHVHRVDGFATLRSKHGGIRVNELGGEAEVTGGYGDVEIDTVDADARIRTTYGNVRLGRVSRGELSVSSSHGRVEIGIAPGSAAWLDLDTDGRISNDLSRREDPTGFDDTVSVHVRSHAGNIVIRRA